MIIPYEVESQEYDQMKQMLLKKYAVKSRAFFAPKTKNWLMFLVRFMETSNHLMNKPAMRYIEGTRRLDFFQFNRAKIIIEWWEDKEYMIVVLPHKIERNFKVVLMRLLFERCEVCIEIVNANPKKDMYWISEEWRKSMKKPPSTTLLPKVEVELQEITT